MPSKTGPAEVGVWGDFSLPTFEKNTLFLSITYRNLTRFSLQPLHFYGRSAWPVKSGHF